MPKKPSVTEEAIIEGAFGLIRENGYEALTVRNLAAYLGCSTQPVMYRFPSMDTLKDLAYQRADAFHSGYILAGGDLLEIGMRYIRFAQEEPMLFRFLFQSGRFSGLSPEELINAPGMTEILDTVGSETGLDHEGAAAYFEPLFAVVHGYASLVANNAVKYDPDSIRKVLVSIADGLQMYAEAESHAEAEQGRKELK